MNPSKESKQPPWFVYLQGGLGLSCRPPQNYNWCDIVLDRGYKILLLDQRGTGLSSTVTARTLATIGGPEQQAAFFKQSRPDRIVKDCESTRKLLTADYPEDRKKWSICGQSFGGFCCVNYLSLFPESLTEVFTVGGLSPLVKHRDIARLGLNHTICPAHLLSVSTINALKSLVPFEPRTTTQNVWVPRNF